MTTDTIRYTLDAAVATVTLDRPDVRNGLNRTLRSALRDAVLRAAGEARVLVRPAPEPPSARARTSPKTSPPTSSAPFATTTNSSHRPLRLPHPDDRRRQRRRRRRRRQPRARLRRGHRRRVRRLPPGLRPHRPHPHAGGTWWLPRQVGFARAMGAALFAEPVTARDAAAWGMIWQAVPDADFAATVAARARQLAEGPTAAYRLIKQALRTSLGNTLPDQLGLEARLQAEAAATADFREGVAAFLEKRPARYEGR